MLRMALPPVFAGLLELALRPVPSQLTIAGPIAELAEHAWRTWWKWREPSDNRAEHELVVLANVLRIGVEERLLETELRIAAAFALLHDTHFIPRITEARTTDVRRRAVEARRAGRLDEAVHWEDELRSLESGKDAQRRRHMAGGAETADHLLRRMPDLAGTTRWLTDVEAEKCVAIIAGHDRWKLGEPHPPTSDWLAVVCLEADALWPLHPLGVQADLERPDEAGFAYDLHDPSAWRRQLAVSVQTLRTYRANWPIQEQAAFQDGESIFRTPAGHRRYAEWLDFWGLPAPVPRTGPAAPSG